MTADEFLEQAGPLLLADEARHNLILGIAGTAHHYPEARFWVVDGAAALQTPPYNLVLATPRDTAALRALADAIDGELPGVTGTEPEVHEFARLWGRPFHVIQEHNVFVLDAVVPPAPVEGSYREATRGDVDLLLRWWQAFIREALPQEEAGPRDRDVVLRKLDDPNGGIGLWEDEGIPVSMCGYGSPTPNGIRIGPVYTPPELRGHGYASALTAEVSQRALAGGRAFCFLYTDRANPTSNAIYERIGYRKVAEAAAVAFA